MVHIVTGNINAGKSSNLKKRFDLHGLGAGVIGVKLWKEGDIYGYKAHILPDGSEQILMIHQRHYLGEFENFGMIGPYFYNIDVFKHTNEHIIIDIEKGLTPIYIDEVGILELSEGGYHPSLDKAASKHVELYISCRKDLVNKIVSKYQFNDYEVIEIEGKTNV
jgi:nucleoside-triphosphatase THEP1